MWIVEGLTESGTEVLVRTFGEECAQSLFDAAREVLPSVTMYKEV